MAINNFNLIRGLLEFNSPNDFYFVQIIRRNKENPGLNGKNNHSRCIKSYYINSFEKFDNYQEEIIKLCEMFNARAYIKLNYCDSKKIGLQMLKHLADCILSGNDNFAKRAYDSCCGRYSGDDKSRKYWIIDLDGEEVQYAPEIINIINNKCKPKGDKFVGTIPTKNGIHLITRPFDKQEFSLLGCNLPSYVGGDDIKKEALTILYCI